MTTDNGNNNVTVAHKGGDSLEDSDTRISITNESTDTTATFEEGSGDTLFSVGDEIVINADSGGSGEADLNGSDVWSGRTASDGSTSFKIQNGNQYTVQLIDTESQRVIWETTVTA